MTKTLQKNYDSKSKRKFGKKIAVITFFIISLFVMVKLYFNTQIQPISSDNIKNIVIEIPKGSSTYKIGEILKDKNLIKNKNIFVFLAKLNKIENKIKAGKYELNTGMTNYDILDVLVKGRTLKETVTVTIPEGYDLKQIAEKLSKNGIVNSDKFLELTSNIEYFKNDYTFLKELPDVATLEGYLFPDTYEFYRSSKEEEVIRKMLDRFNEILKDEYIKKAKSLNMTINEVITLASIIEREGKVDSERTLISAVFHNRLKSGMMLQSCATVQYALGEVKENLTYEDLKIDSEYNTYIHDGLPPGPIASPGIKSIEAAVNPADVDYLYFVANGDGTHTFSTDLKDHINAKNRK